MTTADSATIADTVTPSSSDPDADAGTATPSAPTAPSARCTPTTDLQTITVWQIFGGDEANLTFQSLVNQFNVSHPGITVQVVKLNGLADMRERLEQSPDQWADILVTAPSELRSLIDSGAVVRPGECTDDHADLLPVVRASYVLDGQLQAEPYGVSTPVLMFDAAEARKAGLDPDDPPRTFEELQAASRQVVESGVSPHGFVVHDGDAEFLLYQAASRAGTLIAVPDNAHGSALPVVDLDTPENVKLMRWLSDVVTNDDGVWIGSAQASADLVKIIDPTDGAVFSIHTSASIGDILTSIDAGGFGDAQLGVGPMPGVGVGATVGGNAMYIIDHHDPGRAAAAWQAVSWLTQPENMAVFDAATGYVPTSTEVAADPTMVAAYAKHPQLRVGYDQLLASAGTVEAAGPSFGPAGEVDEVLNDLTTKVVGEHEDPATALREASTAINGILQGYATATGG